MCYREVDKLADWNGDRQIVPFPGPYGIVLKATFCTLSVQLIIENSIFSAPKKITK